MLNERECALTLYLVASCYYRLFPLLYYVGNCVVCPSGLAIAGKNSWIFCRRATDGEGIHRGSLHVAF